MPKQAPGAKAKSLGAELRAIRKSRMLTLAAVTGQLAWTESTLSRLETGKRNVSAEEVASLLTVYGINGPQRDHLLAMARTPDQPGWLQVASGIPMDSVTLATHEQDANHITDWAPLLIPGLLQTMEYSRAFMLADGLAEDQIGARLMARQRRQERLASVAYTAYLYEPVLNNPVGGPEVLRAQLTKLLVAAEAGAILRVIPGDVGAHPALIGPFVALHFPDANPIVHVELSRSGVFLADPAEVECYKITLDHLSSSALDASHSTRLIGKIARGRREE